jgi:tetrahydromethanopterin S-methyltransferase subunit F
MSEKKDDVRENIDDIEKTVEDLKKKIQEISEESREEKDMDESVPRFAEAKKKIREIRENTVRSVNQSIADVKEAAEKPHDLEEFSKTMSYIKDNAQKAVESARIRIDEIKNDPKVKSGLQDVQDKGKEALDKTKNYIDSKLSDKQKEDLKNTSEKAGKVLNDTARSAAKAMDDFVNKPEVQEFNRKAGDLAEKGVNKVKDFFNKKN